MFPRDTQFIYGDVSATGNTTILATSTRTILSMNIVSNSNTPIGLILCGANEIYDNKQIGSGVLIETNIVCNSAIYVNKSSATGGFSVYINYVPRDRTITPDPIQNYATTTQTPVNVTNWPTGFNVNNWTFATSTTVLNQLSSSTLSGLNVLCTNCSTGTSTGTGSSTYIINGGYNGMNLQESLFVACVIIALLSYNVYRFIFGKPTEHI